MKTIRVVLTKYSDPLSILVYLLSGCGYTHASIALGGEEGLMYSFNFKGFCVETLAKHRRRGVKKSMSIQLDVSEAAYSRMEGRIRHMESHREEYCYTKLGVLLSFLHIPFKWERWGWSVKKLPSCGDRSLLHPVGETGKAERRQPATGVYPPSQFITLTRHNAPLNDTVRGIPFSGTMGK